MVIIQILAPGQDVADIQGIQPADVAFVRIHGEEPAAVKGIEEIDGAVIFAEATVIVQVAGSIAHGALRIHDDALGEHQKGSDADDQGDDDDSQCDFYGFL